MAVVSNRSAIAIFFCVVVLLLMAVIYSFPTSSTASFSASADTSTTAIGATYSASTASTAATYFTPLPPERVVSAVTSLGLASLRLDNVSDPTLVGAFLHSNTTLLLTIPNELVPPLAANRSNAVRWLESHVLPFYPRTKITAISVGKDILEASPDFADSLLPAIRNVRVALVNDLGVREISVSTTFAFADVITTPFPPSAARFQELRLKTVIQPVLQFLSETNSPFFIDVYPYKIYPNRSDKIPVAFPLFQPCDFSIADDNVTAGTRYSNLFDMMVDAVITAMAVAGHDKIPLVVTETGWPSSSADPNEGNANPVYAEMYLKGLVGHLNAGRGTPLRKEGVAQVFIYELLDNERTQGLQWGILNRNFTGKYNNLTLAHGSVSVRTKTSLMESNVIQLLVLVTEGSFGIIAVLGCCWGLYKKCCSTGTILEVVGNNLMGNTHQTNWLSYLNSVMNIVASQTVQEPNSSEAIDDDDPAAGFNEAILHGHATEDEHSSEEDVHASENELDSKECKEPSGSSEADPPAKDTSDPPKETSDSTSETTPLLRQKIPARL